MTRLTEVGFQPSHNPDCPRWVATSPGGGTRFSSLSHMCDRLVTLAPMDSRIGLRRTPALPSWIAGAGGRPCPRGLHAVFNPDPKDRLITLGATTTPLNGEITERGGLVLICGPPHHATTAVPLYSWLRTVLAQITSVEIVGWAINPDLPRGFVTARNPRASSTWVRWHDPHGGTPAP